MSKDINGIIVINKEEDFTSHDCVAILRRKLGIKRIGHTGTLDPMAKGLMVLCIGSATRLIDYTDWDLKEYRCKLILGKSTDTDDIWGKTISEKKVDRKITKEEVEEVLSSFLGHQTQVPPMYSAIKVDGKKLYQYARKGEAVSLKGREVYFHKISLINLCYEDNSLKEIEFDISCSKGTYIRSLCRDIGNALGFPATMSALRRTRSGSLDLDLAISILDVKDMKKNELLERLLPTEKALEDMKRVDFSKEEAKDFVNGKKLSLKKLSEKLALTQGDVDAYFKRDEVNYIGDFIEKSTLENVFINPRDFSKNLGFKKDYFLVFNNEKFIGVGKIHSGAFTAHKVFDIRMQNEDI